MPFATSNMLELSVWRSGIAKQIDWLWIMIDAGVNRWDVPSLEIVAGKKTMKPYGSKISAWIHILLKELNKSKGQTTSSEPFLHEPWDPYMIGGIHIHPMQTTATWSMVVQHQRPAIGPATSFILKRQRHQRSTAHQKVPLPVAKSRTAFCEDFAGWKVTRITRSFIVFFIHTNGLFQRESILI